MRSSLALEAEISSLSTRAPDEDLHGAQRTESDGNDAEEEGDEACPLDQHQPLLSAVAGPKGFKGHSKAVWKDDGRDVGKAYTPQGQYFYSCTLGRSNVHEMSRYFR